MSEDDDFGDFEGAEGLGSASFRDESAGKSGPIPLEYFGQTDSTIPNGEMSPPLEGIKVGRTCHGEFVWFVCLFVCLLLLMMI